MAKSTTKSTTTTKKKKPSSSGVSFLKIFLILFVIGFIIVSGTVIGFVTASLKNVPSQLGDMNPPAASQFFDANGQLIATTKSEENRIPVKLSAVPKDLQNAFIAIEDIRFYQHMGVDPRAILRAAVNNFTNNTLSEGGSTITQQLAKNAVLTQDRTLKRKIQEAFVAIQIEKKYSKSEILEMYLNQIYFGQGAYGIQSASRVYFGKDVGDLSLAQSAMLAGIPKSPNFFSPLSNFKEAKARQEVVLDQMVKYGFISPSEANAAKNEKIDVTSHLKNNSKILDYYIDYVTQIVIDKFGADTVYKEGLKIYTSIDMKMQRAAENTVNMLPTYFSDENNLQQPQYALVAVDPRNGHIKAMVGGRGTDQFNRSVLAVRQPGSAFKPFVFLAAIDSGFTPATVLEDKKLKLPGYWSPENYDRKYHGKVTMRTALINSYNIPTVFLTQQVTPEKVIDFAQRMGISTLVLSGSVSDINLAMSLGGLTRGVIPLEMASAFGVLANNGVYVEPTAVLKVVDRNNKVIYTAQPNGRQVISDSSAYLVTDMMQDVIRQGTGYAANIGRPAAGKTGTTSEYKDAWFVGFTPDLSTAVWIGNDSGEYLHGMTGGDLPASIWASFMSEALSGSPPLEFTPPPGGIVMPKEPKLIFSSDDANDPDNPNTLTANDSPNSATGEKPSDSASTPPLIEQPPAVLPPNSSPLNPPPNKPPTN